MTLNLHMLLSVKQMQAADAATIAAGTPGQVLMERAGEAVAGFIQRRFGTGSVLVLAGPGNNGGDGYVVARLLQAAGRDVAVVALGKPFGGAALVAAEYKGEIATLDKLNEYSIIVDALFGTGLARPIEGEAAEMLKAVEASGLPVVAVDIPTGVQGDSGEVMGMAVRAAATVTFCCRKPAHLLYPGRDYCGEVVVADIGITKETVVAMKPDTFENRPSLWREKFPWPAAQMHKYDRGHAVIAGGPLPTTGASKLAARAALRIGAGLVSVVCTEDSLSVYASSLTAVMTKAMAQAPAMLEDPRYNAWLIGPGAGVDEITRQNVLTILEAKKAAVFDADALTAFAESPQDLFEALNPSCILTPHEGEFAKLFPDLKGDKVTRAREAAKRSCAVIVLKGADTVVASPDGKAAIAANAPPSLATAGTGDVLAGMCLGLLAQGMPVFDAACAAVWMHGEAASRFGLGLIAEDLPEQLPAVLQSLDALK